MNKPGYIIGIDPDVDKSGFAIIDVRCKSLDLVTNYSFSEIIEAFKAVIETNGTDDTVVIIEDSDNLHNWHLPEVCSAASAAAIGKKVGLCHATQRHIQEVAEYLGLKVELQAPLRKGWLGRDGKITQEEVEQFVPTFPKKSNQEQRDATLLAWCYAELPIHIPAEFYQAKGKKDTADKKKEYAQQRKLTQIMKGYEKARKKTEKSRWTASEFRKWLAEDKTPNTGHKKAIEQNDAQDKKAESADKKV